MTSLQVVICVFLSIGLEISAEVFEGTEREKVVITCSHKWAESNKKYFCKDPCKNDEDMLIDSDKTTSGRYHLQDEGTGDFRVTITDLKKTDSGKYWCAVKRAVMKTYNEVDLRVLDVPQRSSPPSSSALPTTVSFLEITSTSNATNSTTNSTEWTRRRQTNKESKTVDWQFYAAVSASVILLTCLVWILVSLALCYKGGTHPILKYLMTFWCCSCSEQTEFEGSDYNESPFENYNTQKAKPGNTDPVSDYEDIWTVTCTSSVQNIYTLQ